MAGAASVEQELDSPVDDGEYVFVESEPAAPAAEQPQPAFFSESPNSNGTDSALDLSDADDDLLLRLAKLESENHQLKRQLQKKKSKLKDERHNFLALSRSTESEIASLRAKLQRSNSDCLRLQQENQELQAELVSEKREHRQVQLVTAGCGN
ncbi:hypothetical protein BOX15_Mlig000958g2 [Macrostomum lignano]|uniref:Uncharacterized protein n=1 Tax=Macrostomum lignano TaxID=282301 RepID=A0A267G263_9PLAT|nr:hypothetical protein BOX15_Mlig013669g4 [Macrostomum lignano]PAA72211.1 hypothetical protein BOX15_Mlig013669g2 [Macrostomum lignano]PAA80076.1 hypothetical protein BOX15_Mlig000958g2 [Macrostomum lignano]